MKIAQVFFEKRGKPSLKRIWGTLLLVNGIIGKNLLTLYAIKREVGHYSEIDSSFNTLIYGGVALIFGSIADKFFLRRK